MFRYEGKSNNKFNILDTDDGVVESISGEDLCHYLSNGIEINGVSFNDNGDIEDKWGDVIFALPKKSKNNNLTKAKKAKNDEFYTQLSDIEKELSHYPPEIFKDKVIYCPMDVATTQGAILRSEFVHYFQMHAHELQFKELIATCLHDKSTGDGYADDDVRSNNYHLKRREVSYATPENKASGISPIAEVKNEFGQMCYKYSDGRLEPIPDNVMNECILDTDGNLIIESEGTPQLYHYEGYFFADCKPDDEFDENDVEGSNKRGFYGSGDFRSKKCLSYLEQCDIVVTNPPFSLFRDFIKYVTDADKKFIIIGNINCLTYKEFFPHIMLGEFHIGHNNAGGTRKGNSMSYLSPADDNILKDVQSWWFNNLDNFKSSNIHDKSMYLKKIDWESNGVEYVKYDNYDAIEVSAEKKIPIDYEGVMGIPVTALRFVDINIFEIIGLDRYTVPSQYLVSGRVAINGKPCYARVLIRHRKDENGKLI